MDVFTRPISRSLVSMTTMVELCSHSIRQKSSVVSPNGPWVAMYAFCCLQIGTEIRAVVRVLLGFIRTKFTMAGLRGNLEGGL